jgi:outer membrane lipoprotein-sorting protein
MTRSHLIGFRLDMDIMGSSNYQMLNATEGWVFMPVMGMTEPKKMEDDQYKSASSQLDIQGALLNYKDKGTTIELLGKDKVDNAEAYKLKLTLKSGKVVTYFLDAKTYFLIKTASKQNVQGEEMDMETTFADFKQNADGFWFPYSTTSMQGTITFDKIETNVKVEDSLFKN